MTTTKLDELVRKHKIRISSKYGMVDLPYHQQDEWQRRAHPYRVTLRMGRRSMSVDWWQGQACTDDPTAADVLANLLGCEDTDNHDFESWCLDYGYNTDSRKAEQAYNVCRKLTAKLRRFLGDAFDAFRDAASEY